MRPVKRRSLSDTPGGRLQDLIETTKGTFDQKGAPFQGDQAAEGSGGNGESVQGTEAVARNNLSSVLVCLN
jgi:hypothetical protein